MSYLSRPRARRAVGRRGPRDSALTSPALTLPALTLAAAAVILAPNGAASQEAPPSGDDPGVEDPRFDDPLEEELSEATRDAIERFLFLMGPMLERFGDMIGDLPAYEAPIILPNGDILIRRKRDPFGAPQDGDGVEL